MKTSKVIWIINHYAELPENGVMLRHYNFAKELAEKGYIVCVFTSSAIHNTKINMIKGKNVYKHQLIEGVNFIHIKVNNYYGNGISRFRSLIQFFYGVMRTYQTVAMTFGIPEVVYASSFHPLSLLAGEKISTRYKCKYIVEIRDLWLDAHGRDKIILTSLVNWTTRKLEEYCMVKAQNVIFTMEGGKQYIIDRKLCNKIDIEKIHHINNGVDIKTFDYNKEHYIFKDVDIENSNAFIVNYTGSIRYKNNVSTLIDVAVELKKLCNRDIKILLWGEGNELNAIREKIKEMELDNIIVKGHVEKKYIPYILSKGNLNILHYSPSMVFKYGTSQNKNFEYLASGKPILNTVKINYDIVSDNDCGMTIEEQTIRNILNGILLFYDMPSDKYLSYCIRCRNLAEKYDFKNLTEVLIHILQDN